MIKKKTKLLAIIVLLFLGIWLLQLSTTLPPCKYLGWLSLLPAQAKLTVACQQFCDNDCPNCDSSCLSLYYTTAATCGIYSVSDCKCICKGQCGDDDDDDTPPQPPDQVEAGQRRFGVFDPNTPDITVDFPPGAADVPVEVRAAYTDLPPGVAPPRGEVIGAPFWLGAWVRGEGKTVDKFNESIVINVNYGNKPVHSLSDSPVPTESCLPPEGWVLYEMQVGDTLDSLAELTQTSVEALLQVNCLSSSAILPGQQLYLPFIPPMPPGSPITPTLTSTSALTASTSEVTQAVPGTQQANAQLSMYDPHTQAWVALCSRNDFYGQKVSGALILPTPLEEGGNALLAVTIDHIPPLNQTVDTMGKTTLSLPGSNFSFDVLPGTVEVGTYFETTPLLNAPDSASFKLLPTPVDVKACQADYTTANKVQQITQFTKPIEVMFYYDANTLARAGGKNNLTIVSFQNRQWADLEEFGASVVRGDNTMAVESSNLGTFSMAVR